MDTKGLDMKTIGGVVCAFVMAAGCVDGGATGETASALAGSGAGSGATNPVFHSVWNGGNAAAQSWGWYSNMWIDAFENLSGPNRAAYLNYSFSSVDPTSEQCYAWTDWWGYTYSWCYYTRFTWGYGWGRIPAQAFQVTRDAAHLMYTVGSDTTFSAYQCTVDYSSWAWTCGVPTGGSIDVAWSKDGSWSQSHSGMDQYSFGPYSYQTSGTWTASAAHATGSLLDTSVDASGFFGDTHQSNVTKDIVNTPHP